MCKVKVVITGSRLCMVLVEVTTSLIKTSLGAVIIVVSTEITPCSAISTILESVKP